MMGMPGMCNEMFTAAEVGALITAGKFLNCHGDESFIKDFDSARD